MLSPIPHCPWVSTTLRIDSKILYKNLQEVVGCLPLQILHLLFLWLSGYSHTAILFNSYTNNQIFFISQQLESSSFCFFT